MFKFEFENYTEKKRDLDKILKSFLEKDLGFYELVNRSEEHDDIKRFAEGFEGKLKNVVVLGIGGSALGIKTIRDTLLPKSKRDYLRIIDNVDPDFIYENVDDLDLSNTMFVVITKSGGTSETISLFMTMKNAVEKAGLDWVEHFTFVTDPEDGLLRQIAERDGVPTFEVPKNVGGRYSVLSAVGLVPAALAGVNIDDLIKGAAIMRNSLTDDDPNKNLCFQMASFQSCNHNEGRKINVLFPYSNKLIRFGEWYAQLLAESIGKNSKIGLTPVTALGATDQHSQLQLYSDGPDDKIYQFIEVKEFDFDKKIEVDMDDEILSDKFDFLNCVSFSKLLNTELQGTLDSLKERKRPILKIGIEKVDAETLGGLFMLYEGATALLGEMLEVDAFNQPGVERSKVLTKKYLSQDNA
jgi:glucose-6-phosphate isomerase